MSLRITSRGLRRIPLPAGAGGFIVAGFTIELVHAWSYILSGVFLRESMHMRCWAIGYLVFLAAACSFSIVEAAQGSSLAQSELPAIKKNCALCHLSGGGMKRGAPALKKAVAELCIECHPDSSGPNHHAVDIVPSMKVARLPLARGKLRCTTCHDPHTNPYGRLLRLPADKLCLACHNV